MAVFVPRPIALLVCGLFAGAPLAHGAEQIPVTGVSATETPLRLRMERRFNALGGYRSTPRSGVGLDLPFDPRPGDVYPLFVDAERLEGQADDEAVATGNVRAVRAGARVTGERLTYRPLDDIVEARGDAHLLQEGQDIRSPYLRLQLSERIGHAEETRYEISREVVSRFQVPVETVVNAGFSNAVNSGAPMMMNIPAAAYGLPTVAANATRLSEASGVAARAEFEGGNRIRLFDATYSTCKPESPDWYLRASEMLLDYDGDVGAASHASLWFKDVPLFYTPAGTFPLNSARRSGFLHPFFATSTRDGVDLTLPYYFNLAPNYDLTVFTRMMSKRGLQLAADANYLDHNATKGRYRAEYMPEDKLADRDRYAYQVQHAQALGRGFSGVVNYNRVSDDFYWQDLSSRLLQTSQVQLPQQALLAYSPAPWLQSNLNYLRYQTLQTDPANPVTTPYFLEPQFNVIGFRPNVALADIAFIGQYTRFSHPTFVEGDRFVAYPQVSLPFVRPAFSVIPKVGLHATQYSLNNQAAGLPDSFTRSLPVFSVDSVVNFERETTLFERGFIQTLEPRVYYVNIPYKDQSQYPVFDSALTDFNFAQVFAENRYSGFDRINDANQVTAALTTRMLDSATGVERFKALVGQRYYFRQSRVGLPGETPPAQGWSNLIMAFNGLVAPKTYADASWEYNYRDNENQRYSLGLRFQPEFGKVVSASYRYTRDPLSNIPQVDQIDIAGQWPLTSRLFAVGRYNYSRRDSQLLEGIAGLEYNAGCWAFRVVGQRLEALAGEPNTSVFVQLELTDFASVGANPIGLLRRSIPGYGKSNELPSSSSQLMNP